MLNKGYAELDTLYCFMMTGGAGLGEPHTSFTCNK